ncbi:hypothetical protein EBN03_06670 [Nocardia stercoris]|uniref:Uncharacterized protein n=1 Tax=Nocardia stercoris TaxID=2483361 RepID=A0A3M2LH77_9NOCA|nr:hypothetical protein EBN03_06670 [Nocardia stercoris]
MNSDITGTVGTSPSGTVANGLLSGSAGVASLFYGGSGDHFSTDNVVDTLSVDTGLVTCSANPMAFTGGCSPAVTFS